VDQQWNALGALAQGILRQAAEARQAPVARLRQAEAEQGAVAYDRRSARPATKVRPAEAPRQLELPLM